jgi:hypothetical protein
MVHSAFKPSGTISKYEILDARPRSVWQEAHELWTKECPDGWGPIT